MSDIKPLTKTEISRAYQFLYKVVIPKCLREKLLHHISVKEICKSLKIKKKTDTMIYLGSKIKGEDEFKFIILKTSSSDIDVGYFPTSYGMFFAPIYSKLNESINYDEITRSNIEKHIKKHSINKFEESYAFNFLNKVVIPKAVQHYNSVVENEAPSRENHYKLRTPINIVDVIRNLKKTKHIRGNFEGRHEDKIEYTSKLSDITFTFYIEKVLDQRPDRIRAPDRGIVLSVKYEDPFSLQSHVFQVGEKYL